MLPVCIEAIIRLFFTAAKIGLENWGWILTFVIIALLLIATKTPIAFGIIGSVLNALDSIPIVNVLLGIKFLTPIGVSIMWAGMILQARTVLWPVRIFALPIFMLTGFVWDAFTNLPIPGLGGIADFIPLTLITSFLLTVPGLAYVVIAIPAFYGLKIWIWGAPKLCGVINSILEWLA